MNARLMLAVAALVTLSGCRIFPAPTPAPIYYVAFDDAFPAETNTATLSAALRLSTVTAAPAISERFAFTTANEMRFDDMQRWHEPPEVSLERRLSERLFESGRHTRASFTSTPSLTVHLTRYETNIDMAEVVTRAHVIVTNAARDITAERTITAREPTDPLDGREITASARRALDALISQIIDTL